MQKVFTQTSGATPDTRSEAVSKMTRALLVCGIIAGPVYTVVGLLQAFTRPGFDITRHPLSLLSNGDLGWIQVANFVATGLLLIAGAVGMRRALPSGRGRTWGPLLIGVYGLGMIGAGIFKSDPAPGFPIGTPADATAISTSGLLHFAMGGIGFLGLIVGCFIFARRFASLQQRSWALYSVITGVVFFAAFIGIASGAGNRWTVLGFWIGILLGWSWISSLSARLRGELAVVK